MDLQLFETFLTVARIGTISHAAEQLNFTQPTVTAQIQTLERQLGVLLFERIGKKIYLTDAGRQLQCDAPQLLAHLADIEANLEPYRSTQPLLTLGISTQVISYLLPPLLEQLQEALPTVQAGIETVKNSSEVLRLLLDNQADIGLLHGPAAAPQISQYPLWQEEIVWVVSKARAARHAYSTTLTDYPIVNFKKPGSVFRAKFEAALQGQPIISAFEYSDSEAVKHAVLNGLGASYLPLVLVQQGLASGDLLRLDGPPMQLTLSLALHKQKPLSRAMRAFLRIAAQQPAAGNELQALAASLS